MTSFDVEVHQNEYLAVGATEVSAVVRVTASGSGGTARTPMGASEIIIVDVSGSMAHPRSKIDAARKATMAAIGCIGDGVNFAVIAGSSTAQQVYPGDGVLAMACADTRAAAIHAVQDLKAAGGTVMASWLRAASDLFATRPGAINHAILLTDGKDESPELLDPTLAACEGHFQCDCRGVGADWDVDQLRQVASALLGDLGLIRRPDDLATDFTELMQKALARGVSDVSLRIWTPQTASVTFVKQVVPVIEDLTGRRAAVSAQIADYPTGAWSDEARDYHLWVEVPPREVDEEMLAARVSVVVNDTVIAEGKVRAVWTGDEALSTRLNPHVVRSTGHEDYAAAVKRGVAALRDGDERAATTNLGRAAQIASALHDGAKLEEVARVVHIENADRGTVRLRPKLDDLDVMELDTNSTRTVRIRSSSP